MVRYTQTVKSKQGSVQAPRRTRVMRTTRTGPRKSQSMMEKKFLDTAATNLTDLRTGVILNSVNLIPQGMR